MTPRLHIVNGGFKIRILNIVRSLAIGFGAQTLITF